MERDAKGGGCDGERCVGEEEEEEEVRWAAARHRCLQTEQVGDAHSLFDTAGEY